MIDSDTFKILDHAMGPRSFAPQYLSGDELQDYIDDVNAHAVQRMRSYIHHRCRRGEIDRSIPTVIHTLSGPNTYTDLKKHPKVMAKKMRTMLRGNQRRGKGGIRAERKKGKIVESTRAEEQVFDERTAHWFKRVA